MLKIGLSIKIRVDNKDYSSRIEDMDSDYLYISTPMEKGQLVHFSQGSKISVYIIVKGAVYNFEEKIKEQIKSPVPLLKISKPDKLKKIQRRQFFRLEKKLPVKYKILDDDCESELSDTKDAYALDISGGGLKLATQEIIPVNSFLELNFELNIDEGKNSNIHDIRCVGKIVRTQKVDTDRVSIYHYGVKFISLPSEIQDTIVRFIFNEQRKLRLKGRFSHAKREY
ncbi:flagellar brake protein [Natranaerobius thermophilus]|uniref:Type IV pilus assembly PilZ n=1 Tax=Natranaerobius thermophilus (strain ATCC BAA-1301 / DSM 18059 / JW/NM-WN-LF) TaxID=457570 RepID=B2A369_NATTJ|nr:flagellar brake domain-containing protein [Natranaerobius thermophilus]ACB84999.1 type IV pilus assembly PilZ [Natranaerobius thermophilus JW/NM-WN-LF]